MKGRRFFAFALALCLCLALLPGAALALDGEPVPVTTAEELAEALPSGEHEITPVAELAADITVDASHSIRAMGRIIVPEGFTLTVADGAYVEAGVINRGTVVVQAGGTLATTMNGDIENHGTITVQFDAALLSQMGGVVDNRNDGTLTLDGVFTCNGYVDGGNVLAWFRNEGALSGDGWIYVPELASGDSLENRIAAAKQIAEMESETEFVEICVEAKDEEEILGLSEMPLSSVLTGERYEIAPENSISMLAALIVPKGTTLTILSDAYVEAGVLNYGTVVAKSGSILATTMNGDIENHGSLTVERYARLLSQMGGAVVNCPDAALTLDGLFICHGHVDGGKAHAWFQNSGTVRGGGQIVLEPLFSETALSDRLSAYEAMCAALGGSDVTPYIAATNTAELIAANAREDVAGVAVTATQEARQKDDTVIHLTEPVDLGSKKMLVEDANLELDSGATLTVAHRDKLAYVGRYSKVVVKAEGGTLCFADAAIIGGTAGAGAIFTVTGGEMFTGGAQWAAFGHRYPTDASSEWYYVQDDGAVSAKGSLTEDTYLPLMVDGVLNVTGDFTTGTVEIRNELNEAGGKASIRDLLYCWDSRECAVRGTEHTEFDLAIDFNCGNGYDDIWDHLDYNRETGRFYLDSVPELVAPEREGYVFLGWEIVTKWNPTEEQLARIWVQKDEEDRDFVPWPTAFPCRMRAIWAEPDALGEGAIAQAQTVIAENGETMARAAIYCKDSGCVAFAARYDDAGRFLGVEPLPLTPGQFNELVLACGGAERVCFFALNGGSAPLCPAASVERNDHA